MANVDDKVALANQALNLLGAKTILPDTIINAFTDDGDTGHTVTPHGDAQIRTDQKKFPPGAGLFDAPGDYLSIPDHDDFYFNDDFTIDCWVRPDDLTYRMGLYEQRVDDDNKIQIYFWPTDDLHVLIRDGAGAAILTLSGTHGMTINNWHHIALVRHGDIWTLYVDGTAIDTDTVSHSMDNLAADPAIGRWYSSVNSSYIYFNGWIDEFRISKGIARWTANFTPSEVAYDYPDSYTKLLLHMDSYIAASAGFDSGTKEANLFKSLYDFIRKALLRSHLWNFALARASLTADSIAPTWGYSYKYLLPSACLRVICLEDLSYKFKIEGGYLFTDESTVNILYITDEEVVVNFDELFKEAFVAKLAAEMCFTLTHSASLTKLRWDIFNELIKDARSIDAQEGTPDELEITTWLDAR